MSWTHGTSPPTPPTFSVWAVVAVRVLLEVLGASCPSPEDSLGRLVGSKRRSGTVELVSGLVGAFGTLGGLTLIWAEGENISGFFTVRFCRYSGLIGSWPVFSGMETKALEE